MDRSQGRDNWAAMHRGFGWQVPGSFNIAQACCARWAGEPDAAQRVAIIAHGPAPRTLTFAQLQQEANAMSNLLVGLGVRRGDRVAIVLPQRFETAIAYMAVLQLGAVAMPLSILFGPDALEYRLQDSEAVAAICDENAIASIAAVRSQCPLLRNVVGLGGAAAQAEIAWEAQRPQLEPAFAPVHTHPDEGAVLIYTSGTTGPPKGALIPHRALLGNLPGFVCSQNWFPQPGDVFWSPADWAWTGGLMDALLPTLYFGREIVAYQGRFTPERAFELMQRHRVTHSFLFPTALKAMMKAVPAPRAVVARSIGFPRWPSTKPTSRRCKRMPTKPRS